MRVLIVGSGGREHALGWKLARSSSRVELYASPGNPGLAGVGHCIQPPSQTPEAFLQVAEKVGADLTIVGPEAPLVEGLVDLFQSRGKLILGPTRQGALLEGSKIFAKQLMTELGVPTARYVAADSVDAARAALTRFSYPLVIKADGLAAGKGAVIVHNPEEATRTLEAMLSGELLGEAGKRVVLEEFLEGEEVSFIALTDGRRVIELEPTQDHKRLLDGDAGPNTGGMGAYCDSRILTQRQRDDIVESIVNPVLRGLARRGIVYRGFLYAGLMIVEGKPYVLEFNVRLGDPETQPLMHRLRSDLLPYLELAARGELADDQLQWAAEPSVCVVLAAQGYPGSPRKGDVIIGLEDAERLGATVFHAGTALKDGRLVTNGGRVLGVTASGSTLGDAIERTYAAVRCIRFDGMQYRTDIGRKGLRRWSQLE